MFSLVPTWGTRHSPLLPQSLRELWREESLPTWVVEELHLGAHATVGTLDSQIWTRYPNDQLTEGLKAFLENLVSARKLSIWDHRIFGRPWPPALDPEVLPWSARTRNCLRRAGLLSDAGRLSRVTYGQILSLKSMGVSSLLDFSCGAEAAFEPAQETDPPIRSGVDAVSALVDAIDAPWANQVSNQDPRFADLLPPGSQTVFEKIERFTAEPEDPPLGEAQLARALPAIHERMSDLSKVPLEMALSDFVGRVARSRGIQLDALRRRLGCDGAPPATLEEAAGVMGVTRERMRQIQKKFSERIPDHPVFMPQLDDAIRVIRECAPIGVSEAARLLTERGITIRAFHPKSVLAAAEYCGRTQPFEIDGLLTRPRVVIESRREIEREALSIAFKQANASGATNIQEIAAELASRGHSGLAEDALRHLLADAQDVEFIGTDWIWDKGGIPERNRLRNVSRKMLAVAAPISVSDLREGVQRYYRIRGTRGTSSWPLTAPPRAVLLDFYRAHPEFTVDEKGFVASVERLDHRSELNPTERVLHEVIRSSPAMLLDRASFGRSCTDLGMNPNTFSQYLSSSPVIAHIGVDMWSLRGVRVDPAAVEALRESNAARPTERRVLDHGWTERGDLWLAVRLPELPNHFVLGIPSVIRHLVSGRDFPAVDETGLKAGTVRVGTEGTSYGYSPFLTRRGADEDDILFITFRLVEGLATLRLIDDEELEALSPG